MHLKRLTAGLLILALVGNAPIALAGEIVLKNGTKITCRNEDIQDDAVEFVVDDTQPNSAFRRYKVDDFGKTASVYRIPLSEISTVNGVGIQNLPKAQPEGTDSTYSWVECRYEGKLAAKEGVSSGGSAAGGFVGGLLLGLIGTGIAVLVQSEPAVPRYLKAPSEEQACEYAFSDGYTSEGKHKKQMAALTGGLVGTAVFVVIIVAANSGN